MIRKVRIENFKSIADLTLELGRVTVLIGANGSGKSNILEAIAFASAAAQDKLGNEFLSSRGIRVAETGFMRSAFTEGAASAEAIEVQVEGDNETKFSGKLVADETGSYPKWTLKLPLPLAKPSVEEKAVLAALERELQSRDGKASESQMGLFKTAYWLRRSGTLPGFLVYAPENSVLRRFDEEGQILPLGIKGEGLFAHLKVLNSKKHRDRLAKIKEQLTHIDWFENFDIPKDLSPGERSIRIRDRFLPKTALFDQRSANEGFLFLLFYVTLFISPDTPAFFAIDNIDSSLNPKLCTALLQQLVALANEYDKQAIITTHSPAVLDGLDLNDDEQRLVVVDRNKDGHTRVHRINAPKPMTGRPPVSLSEAFMRGYIGGLPNNF